MEAILYLASSEGYGLETPRRCVVLSRAMLESREVVRVKCERPIIYDNREHDVVVLAPRHRGDQVLPHGPDPVAVHVAVALDGAKEVRRLNQLQVIAWAEVYGSAEAAEAAVADARGGEEEGPANRAALRAILDAQGIDSRLYSLEGGDRNDTLCLSREDGRWVVYYTERGARFNERWFSSEAAACRYFLQKMGEAT